MPELAHAMLTNPINLAFIVLVVALVLRYRSMVGVIHLPGILTLLGILGTFLGVCWSLYVFDPHDIAGSMPGFLAGLRFAFITSVIGQGLSFILKWIHIEGEHRNHHRGGVASGATMDTLAQSLAGIQAGLAPLARLEASLAGDGDSTLMTQVVKLRTEARDGQEALVREFRTFAATMAQSNSEALINALSDVIRDFNAKINEQFGENFKELNAAVGRMLEWQENYRQQVEEGVAGLRSAANSLALANSAMTGFAGRCESVLAVAGRLAESTDAAAAHNAALNNHLAAFADLADRARTAMPLLDERIDAATTRLATSTERFSDALGSVSDGVKRASDECLASSAAQVENLRRAADLVVAGVDKAMNETQRQVEALVTGCNETMLKQIQVIDRALETELTNSLKTLAGMLAALSQRFVEDYAPLADRLGEVVRLAEGARPS